MVPFKEFNCTEPSPSVGIPCQKLFWPLSWLCWGGPARPGPARPGGPACRHLIRCMKNRTMFPRSHLDGATTISVITLCLMTLSIWTFHSTCKNEAFCVIKTFTLNDADAILSVIVASVVTLNVVAPLLTSVTCSSLTTSTVRRGVIQLFFVVTDAAGW